MGYWHQYLHYFNDKLGRDHKVYTALTIIFGMALNVN